MATISNSCISIIIINHGAFDLLSKHIYHNSSLPFSQNPIFNLGCKSFPNSRLSCSYKRNKALERCHVLPKISCLMEDNSEPNLDEEEERQSFVSETSHKEATVDLKLPRRSLLVTFTCDACEVRSERLINRLAYERGLVYVQDMERPDMLMNLIEIIDCKHQPFSQLSWLKAVCAGCSKYHKLVDNLGLVVEYNLQEEIDSNTSTDHV